jgi:hypothetical protein
MLSGTFRSRAWGSVLVISLALLLPGCTALIASLDLGGDAPERFTQAIAGGDLHQAYELLCPTYRFGVPFESFRAAVEANPVLLAATDLSINKYESGGGVAVVQKGWLIGNAGTVDAQFHLSKMDGTWCLTGIELGGTPVLPVPGTTSPAPGGAVAQGDRSQIAASLRSDAYRFYGLANPATRRYTFAVASGTAGAPGTQRADLVSVSPRAAHFRIVRGGSLAMLGSLDISLEADGIHLVGSSQGAVEKPALIMPSHLAVGTTWQSEYVETPVSGGEPTTYSGTDVVEGRERIATTAGEFDTVRIATTASVSTGATHATLRLTAWYAEGVGSVRVVSDSTSEGGETSHMVVELASTGS